MSETYLTFDFGTNEDAAQQARHKLDGWKQAFRLDKKLLFKFDRGEAAAPEPAESAPAGAPAKGKAKAKPTKEEKPAAPSGTVKLLVRLYFSDHEKLSAQRWILRLPAEDPFKAAAPRVVPHGDADFVATQEHFENLT
jgi:hypothetical protein